MSSETLHEEPGKLSPETIDQHRAISSLMEEFEAVDWYAQRVEATADPELRAILAHNRDEEKEHAAMVLEWLRRRDPTLDEHLRTYLFKEGSVTGLEAAATGGEPGAGGGEAGSSGASSSVGELENNGCLFIGDLRQTGTPQ